MGDRQATWKDFPVKSLHFSARILLTASLVCVAGVASAQPAEKTTATTTTSTTSAVAPAPGAPGAVAVTTTTTTQTTTVTEAPEMLRPGVEVGLRAGFALPLGDATKGNKLSDGYTGMVPIQLDIGYRIAPKIYVGVYGQYGIGILKSDVKDACDAAGADCTASNIRFGVSVQYHFLTRGMLLPWAGVGAGYEIATSSLSAGGKSIDSTVSGFEFVNVQVGGDFVASPSFRAGPFLGLSVSQYSSFKVDGNDVSPEPSKGTHEWFSFGLRGVYNL